VLGGARSGKSALAERLAGECGGPVVYVATAAAVDDEMAERIAHHRARRPATWRTLEVRTGVVGELSLQREVNTVLVEDLTLLLSNHMEEEIATAESRTATEVRALLTLEANVVLVSNEVGMGLVPENALGRTFRDALGRVNQAAARDCSEVYLIVAGLPLRMK
jgi:adenosylcobinamide kinase/adenosylcobinamide-phosphate guanylyltransferase